MAASPTIRPRPGGSADGQRLWTLDFVLNLLTAHFMFAGYTAMLTVMPLYVAHRHGNDWHLGIIIGSFGVVGLLIRPFGGQWIYTFGPKRVAVAGTAIVALGSLSYIFALSYWWLVPLRMLQGVGLAIGPVATSTIVANLAPPARRAEAMGYMGNAINISFLYSPLVGFSVLDFGGYTYAFLFSGLFAAVGILTGLRISASKIAFQKPPEGAGAGGAPDKPPLVCRDAIFPTLVFLTYTFTTAPINTFLPQWAAQENLGNPGWYYTVFSVTSIVAMGMGGPIADRFGRATVIIPGLLSVAMAMFVMGASFFQLMFLSAGLFAGVGFGLLQPGIQSLTVDRASVKERSAAMATLQQAWDVGGSAGAFVVGPMAGPLGMANVFAITGVGALIGMVGFVVGNGRAAARRARGAASAD